MQPLAWLAVAGILTIGAGTAVTLTTRGIRNNNPLNIRWDGRTQWLGMTGADSAGFVKFETMPYGFRAAARILNTYRNRGVVTLSGIVNAWAPPNENDTAGYIQYVAGRVGKPAGAVIQPIDWPALLQAMARMETGHEFSLTEIAAGVAMA